LEVDKKMKKNTLIVLCGLPASGKSTLAQKLESMGAICVSTDGIRKELFGDENCQLNGKQVFDIAYQRTINCGLVGDDCVFDAMSITKKSRAKLIEIGKNHFDYVVCIVLDTNPSVCIERNANRERQVPYSVMLQKRDSFVAPKKEEGFDEIFYLHD
jgi:predicted kinase